MADDIQQYPILPAASVLRVNALDPDARSGGDGFLREKKRPKGQAQIKKEEPVAENPALDLTSSLLLQDEANLTRSARSVMGEPPPPPTPAAASADEAPPDSVPTYGTPPAKPPLIHFTA